MWPLKQEQTTGMLPNRHLDEDPRNLSYAEMMVFGGSIPDQGNVIARPIIFYNQGRSHSCTMQATVGAIHQTTGVELSQRWGYWKLKTDSKYASSELAYGAFMTEAAKVTVKEGLPNYHLLPNIHTESEEGYLNVTPTEEMHTSAKSNAGGTYLYATLDRGSTSIFDATVKYMHEQKRPVQVGARWHREYNRQRRGGIIPAVSPDSTWAGHDMPAVAWKMIGDEPYLGFIQSWGPSWGDYGMTWMPRNYSQFYSPLIIIPKIKEKDLKIEKYTDVVITEKNADKERVNARELTAMVAKKFPLDVPPAAQARNGVAREIFGRKKLLLTKSTSYLGWKFTDVINHLYAHSRGKTETNAYNLNFKIYRKDYFTK